MGHNQNVSTQQYLQIFCVFELCPTLEMYHYTYANILKSEKKSSLKSFLSQALLMKGYPAYIGSVILLLVCCDKWVVVVVVKVSILL